MNKSFDWVEESRKLRLQEAWQLRLMGERFLKEANKLDPEGYPNSREGQLHEALAEIAATGTDLGGISDENIHNKQIKRYSAKAISIAKKALETLKG